MTEDEKYKIWGDLVEELRGTAGFPIPDEFADDLPFLNYLDQEIFICETCGWWCERSEETQDEKHFGSCVHCHPDDPEEDEC